MTDSVPEASVQDTEVLDPPRRRPSTRFWIGTGIFGILILALVVATVWDIATDLLTTQAIIARACAAVIFTGGYLLFRRYDSRRGQEPTPSAEAAPIDL